MKISECFLTISVVLKKTLAVLANTGRQVGSCGSPTVLSVWSESRDCRSLGLCQNRELNLSFLHLKTSILLHNPILACKA